MPDILAAGHHEQLADAREIALVSENPSSTQAPIDA
jgi:hypothetical protein